MMPTPTGQRLKLLMQISCNGRRFYPFLTYSRRVNWFAFVYWVEEADVYKLLFTQGRSDTFVTKIDLFSIKLVR